MRWVLFLILSYCDPFSLSHVLIKVLSYDKMIHADCVDGAGDCVSEWLVTSWV